MANSIEQSINRLRELEKEINNLGTIVTSNTSNGLNFMKQFDGLYGSLDNIIRMIGLLNTNIRQFESTGDTNWVSGIDANVNGLITKFNELQPAINNVIKTVNDLQKAQTRLTNADVSSESLLERLGAKGLPVDGIREKLNGISNSVKSAFASDNIAQVLSYLSLYESEIRNLDRQINGIDNRERQANTAKENQIKSLIAETQRYVEVQRMQGNNITSNQQVAYYTQQIQKLKDLGATEEQILTIERLRGRASQEVSRQEVVASQQAIEAQKELRNKILSIVGALSSIAVTVTNVVKGIINVVKSSISLIEKGFKGVINTFVKIQTGVKGIISLFGNLGNRVKETGDSARNFSNTFGLIGNSATELRSKLLLVKGAFDSLFSNDLITRAKEVYSSIYSFKNIFTNDNTVAQSEAMTNTTINWAKEMERALGMNASGLIADLNELSGVLYGLGIDSKQFVDSMGNVTSQVSQASESVLVMSRYLSMMGAAGGDTKQVTDKLISGMKGMTASVDDLGLSVREAQMDDFLQSLKDDGTIPQTVGKFAQLNEEAKTYIRICSLMEQFSSKYDVTNIVEALNTLTGRINILNERVEALKTSIGEGLMRVLGYLAPYFITVIEAINRAFDRLFLGLEAGVNRVLQWLGYDYKINLKVDMDSNINDGLTDTFSKKLEDMQGSSNKAKDGVDGLTDSIEENQKAVEEAEKSIMGFDKVSSINTKKDKGADKTGSDFDWKSLWGNYNGMLDDLNKRIASIQGNYLDACAETTADLLNKFKSKIADTLKKWTGRDNLDLTFGFDKDKAISDVKGMISDIWSIIKTSGKFVITLGVKIADDMKIGLLVNDLLEVGKSATNLAKTMVNVLTPAFMDFYDEGGYKVAVWLGQSLDKALKGSRDELNRWSKWFEDHKFLFREFFGQLGADFGDWFDIVSSKLDQLQSYLGNTIVGMGAKIRNELARAMGGDSVTLELEDIINEMDFINNHPFLNNIINQTEEFIGLIGESIQYVNDLFMTSGQSVNSVIFREDHPELANLLDYLKLIKDTCSNLFGDLGLPEEQFKELHPIIGTILDLLTLATSTIKEFIRQLGSPLDENSAISTIGGHLANFVRDGLNPMIEDFNKFMSDEALPWLIEKLKEFSNWLDQNSDKIKDFFSKIGSVAWDVIKIGTETIAGLIDVIISHPEASAIIGGLVGAFVLLGKAMSSLSGVATLVNALGGLSALSGIGAMLGPIALVAGAIIGIGSALVYLFNTNEEFRAKVEEVWGKISEAFGRAKEKIWDNGLKPAFEGLGNVLQQLAPIFTMLVDVLGLQLVNAIDLLSTGIQGICLIFNDLCTAVSGVIDILKGLADIIIGVFTGDIDRIKEGVGLLVSGILDTFGGLVSGIADFGATIVKAVIEIIDNCTGGAISGIRENFDKIWTSIREKIQGLIDKVKSLLGIHSPSTVFRDIGKYLVLGLKEGILGSWKEITKTVSEKFTGIKDKVKDLFGIHSPSKWFEGIGGYMTDGLAIGLSDNTSALNEIATLRDSIQSEFNSINSEIKPDIGSIPSLSVDNLRENLSVGLNTDNDSVKVDLSNSIYEAIEEALENNRKEESKGETHIHLGEKGVNVYDKATMRSFADMINKYINSNKSNVANLDFNTSK